jgi:ABC-type multidrug transport system fused ATPase/permease subunit
MFLLWGIVLAISALAPLVNIYLVSELIDNIAANPSITKLIIWILVGIFSVDFFDNTLRLLSKTRLSKICAAIEFETQVFLFKIIKPKNASKEKIYKAVENLTSALSNLLYYMQENGISALTRFIAIPVILFGIDIKIFLAEILYIILYFIIDLITTKKYQKKVDRVNKRLEDYFEGVLQNHSDPPKNPLLKAISKREDFSFWEWNFLQHISRYMYFLTIVISIFEIVNGRAEIGIILLYTGYMSQIHGVLNQLSGLFDRLTEVSISLQRISREGNIRVSRILEFISHREIKIK